MIEQLFSPNKIIPVVIINDVDKVLKLSETLLEAGINTMEVTLRTENALEVLRKTRSHLGQLAIEEYRLAPHRIELIHLCDQIDDLVNDTRALEQRIAQLRDSIKP